MDELFITECKIAQARQPLLNSEIPDFSGRQAWTGPRIQAFGPNQQQQSLVLPKEAQHEKVYSKPTIPNGQVPPITYSRTLCRKSDYSAYNKRLPQMPTIWPADTVVSQSGLFITPPQSPAEPTPTATPASESDSSSASGTSTHTQRNFSRKFMKRDVKQAPGHLPIIQRTETVQSESADIQSASTLSTPVSAVSTLSEADCASSNLLAASLK